MNHRIRRAIRLNIIAILIGITTATVSAQTTTVMGVNSCGTWIEARAKPDMNITILIVESWLVGYLSGLAQGSGKNVLEGTAGRSMFLWMDNYCKANPLSDLAEGGEALFLELLKKKGLSLSGRSSATSN